MSKAAAFHRKTAAELIQRFPEIVEPLRDGRICITSVPEIAKVITPENRAEVLPRFFHRSSQEAKQVSAALAPEEAPGRGSDRIPASVKRAVWIRDQGRCQWPLSSGGICGSTYRLQFDHVEPRARGGPATVENIRLACDRHDDLAARLVFGDAWMEKCKRRGGRHGPPPP